jgi:AcrR family transcriptional regulator
MSPKPKRPYSSPLRRRQAAITRARIVSAAASRLARDPETELSHETVASEAGVSTRTVYRHFPSVTDLLHAVWEDIDNRLGLSELPATGSAALLAFVPEMFSRLDDNAPVVNALLASNSGHEMSRRTSDRQLRAIATALASDTPRMTRAERARLAAIVRVLTSPMTWHMLRRKTRVTGNEPALAVVWALRRLIGVTGKHGA